MLHTTLPRIVLFISLLFVCSEYFAQQKPDSLSGGLQKIEKKVAGIKKDIKFFEKLLSFKNFKHHHDSVKLAKEFIHEQHNLVKGNKKDPFSLTHEELGLQPKPLVVSDSTTLNHEVFGWYPYWEGDLYKHLNYRLINTIAYFEYEVDPGTGDPVSIHDWKSTPLLDSAKKYGIKILLTVTNFGGTNNRELLKSASAKKKLISNLVELITAQKANGVCIDFEGVPESQKSNYAEFVSNLKSALFKANPSHQIYLALPKVNWQKSIDFPTLTQVVDRFVIMGYPYYGKNSDIAGPVSPIASGKLWEPYNLELSVDYYLSAGIQSNRLLLALPFYGNLWDTDGPELDAKNKGWVGNRTYSYIKSKMPAEVKFDPISKSAYMAYPMSSDQSSYRQCWFESSESLRFKLQLIKDKKLAGMGIWCLGFDTGYDDLWIVIKDEFTGSGMAGDTTVTPPIDNTPQSSLTPGSALSLSGLQAKLQQATDYKTVILFILVLVVLFGGIGFIIAMFEPNTRAFMFNENGYRIYYLGILLVFLVTALRLQNYLTNDTIILITGFLIGILGFYLVNKILQRKKRNQP